MKALKSLIVTVVLIVVTVAGYFLFLKLVDDLGLSDSGILFWVSMYAIIVPAVEAAAMAVVTLAETVLLVISKIRRRELKLPFAFLFAGSNFLLFLLSVYIIIDDLFVPHTGGIISMQGLGTQLMLMSLTPISAIFIVISLAVYFIRRKRSAK